MKLCAHCGGEMRKAHAYHRQDPFCASCYAKEFKSVPCAGGCGGNTKTWHGETPGYCRSCRNNDRRCVRCGEHVARSHLRLPEGVACKRCRNVLAPPKPCSNCGKLSRHTARYRPLGFDEPVCETCRNKAIINCAGCGKHRVQAGADANGRPLCKRCASGETFVCPVCEKQGKRYSARWCHECYWADLADRRCRRLQAILTRPWVKQLVARFVQFLRQRGTEDRKIVLMLKRHASFFALLDREFPRPVQLTTKALVTHIGRDGIRLHQMAVGLFLVDGYLSALPESEVNELGEEKVRQWLLSRVTSEWKLALLRKHEQYLAERGERFRSRGWTGEQVRFTPRTRTLCLRAAVRLLETLPGEVSAASAIQQQHLDAFITAKPGHRNALHSFVMFLNNGRQRFGKLKITRSDSALVPVHNFLSPDESTALLQSWLKAEDREAKYALAGLLMLLYARTAKQAVNLRLESFLKGPDGLWRTRFAATWLTLDARVGAALERHLALRARTAADSPYLFPGRRPGAHLSAFMVCKYLASRSVGAEKLFATCIANAYRSGVRHPKTLVNALGISAVTAVRYWQQLDSRAARIYARRQQRA